MGHGLRVKGAPCAGRLGFCGIMVAAAGEDVTTVTRSDIANDPASAIAPHKSLHSRNEGELASAGLVMLGVIHRDKEGAPLLSRWLDYLKPDVITLEFSRYGMMFRKRHGAALRARLDALAARMGLGAEPSSKGALETLHDYIELPYEYSETSQYADRLGIPLHLVDLNLFSYINLRSMDELLDEKNVRTWFGGHKELAGEVEKARALARLFFDKGIKTFSYTDEMLTRDRHVKEKLALLARHYEEKRVLHVCGWQHLSDPYNIYDSLNPAKVYAHDRSLCI
jgi:hypothetical protein